MLGFLTLVAVYSIFLFPVFEIYVVYSVFWKKYKLKQKTGFNFLQTRTNNFTEQVGGILTTGHYKPVAGYRCSGDPTSDSGIWTLDSFSPFPASSLFSQWPWPYPHAQIPNKVHRFTRFREVTLKIPTVRYGPVKLNVFHCVTGEARII